MSHLIFGAKRNSRINISLNCKVNIYFKYGQTIKRQIFEAQKNIMFLVTHVHIKIILGAKMLSM